MKRSSLIRWSVLLVILSCEAQFLAAQEATPGSTNTSVSAGSARQRAAWQKRLTLGPGDTLNISLFDLPETAQTDVPIRPDGRISFLQANDIMATGLTIDELRDRLDQGLTNYYQNPRTIIAPGTLRSKRYIVLGTVVNKGAYSLDRPLTLIEAIARAGGLETGLYQERTVELTDLSRSFLVRNGQRVQVDFEKLFQRGDLSQNVPLEPGDFLYFASAVGKEVYVLGQVGAPGVMAFAPQPTVIRAISARGGFSDRADRSRVLIVRGSLSKPQTFIVNASDILAGKSQDVKLQSRDIVYVSDNPWIKLEDLIDIAARAFLQSLTVSAASSQIDPIITHSLF
jgi:polysaccharide biosynthesis/export protein